MIPSDVEIPVGSPLLDEQGDRIGEVTAFRFRELTGDFAVTAAIDSDQSDVIGILRGLPKFTFGTGALDDPEGSE